MLGNVRKLFTETICYSLRFLIACSTKVDGLVRRLVFPFALDIPEKFPKFVWVRAGFAALNFFLP
jgi:hypothetical protein